MSMFHCARCDNLRDSDDGCVEYGSKGTELMCVDCMDEQDDEPLPPRQPSESKYDYIYRTLTTAGCPDDIAHELAREKSR
jgi:hypothetical protein